MFYLSFANLRFPDSPLLLNRGFLLIDTFHPYLHCYFIPFTPSHSSTSNLRSPAEKVLLKIAMPTHIAFAMAVLAMSHVTSAEAPHCPHMPSLPIPKPPGDRSYRAITVPCIGIWTVWIHRWLRCLIQGESGCVLIMLNKSW
jgi:hypothetical protein